MDNDVKFDKTRSPNQFIFTDGMKNFKEVDIPEFNKPFMVATDCSLSIIGQNAMFRFVGRRDGSFKVKLPTSFIRAANEALDEYEKTQSPLNSKDIIASIDNKLKDIKNGVINKDESL